MENQTKHYDFRVRDQVAKFTRQLVIVLFDAREQKRQKLKRLRKKFRRLTARHLQGNTDRIWEDFVTQFDRIRADVDLDAQAIFDGDPAARSVDEVYLAYPGFYAIAIYRLSHELNHLGLALLSRMISEFAHATTGIDIHPGATIGRHFSIDHGTGIVIGETSVIHNHVKLFQGVTLGGLKVEKSLAFTKRHPTIEEHVTIYANATILGGKVVIGAHSIVGGNVWITQSLPPHSIVQNDAQIQIKNGKFHQ